MAHEKLATLFLELAPDLRALLKDYFHKLEHDDFDLWAVDKMKQVNKILDQLQEVK